MTLKALHAVTPPHCTPGAIAMLHCRDTPFPYPSYLTGGVAELPCAQSRGHRSNHTVTCPPFKTANTNGGHLFPPCPGLTKRQSSQPPAPQPGCISRKPGREKERRGWEALPPRGARRITHTCHAGGRMLLGWPRWVQPERQGQPKEDQPKGHAQGLSEDSALSPTHLPGPIPEDLDPKGV